MVDPASIVPLCRDCHRAYDAHQLDLLPYLSVAEQCAAVRGAGGIEAARRRITGERGSPTANYGALGGRA